MSHHLQSPSNHTLHSGPQLDVDPNPLPTPGSSSSLEKVMLSVLKLSTGNTRRAEMDTPVCSPTLPKPESSTPGGRACNWIKYGAFRRAHELGLGSLIQQPLATRDHDPCNAAHPNGGL